MVTGRIGARLLGHRSSAADELWVAAADGTGARRLTGGTSAQGPHGTDSGVSDYQAPRWLDAATVVRHQEGHGFVAVPVSGGDPVEVPTPVGEVEQWLVEPDGSGIVTDDHGALLSVRNTDGQVALDRIDLVRGRRDTVAVHPGSISASALHVGGGPSAGVFLMTSAEQPGELWLASGGGLRRLAALNPGLPRHHTVQRVRGDVRSRPGVGLLVPLGSPPADGWPLVISVYGGNARASELVERYEPDNGIVEPGLLTSRGWAVAFPDLPMTDRDPMRQFAPMVREVLDRLPDVLPVDRRRVAVVGNSYGSYTTLSLLVTMPETFCAAAVSAPLINPIASYGAMYPEGRTLDGLWESGQGRLGVPPWADPETWVVNSPYLFLDRVDAPVLIGVGGPGLPGEEAQAEQLFTGLRRLGRSAELRRYPGEGHAPTASWGPAAYADFATRLVDWVTGAAPLA